MKAKLEFEFELPEERELYEYYQHATDSMFVLTEFKNKIRNMIKHDDNLSDETYDTLEHLYQDLIDSALDNGITFL